MGNNFVFYVLAVWLILYLLHYVRRNKDISAPEFLTHGGISVMLFLTLLLYPQYNTENLMRANVILFSVTTIEGIAMYALDLTRAPLSVSCRMTHRILAVLSLGVLFAFVFGYL